METAYYILNHYFSLAHWLSLIIIFIATLIIWKVVAKKKWTQAAFTSLFVTYIIFILMITLIARASAAESKVELIPFWSWYEVIAHHGRGLLVEIILNVIFFMPVGILARLQGGDLKRVAMFSICLSLAIEVMQYFTCRGLMEWDDVFGNTSGACIGWYLGNYIKRVWSLHYHK